MKTSRYAEPQIITILRQAEGGLPVAVLWQAHGMSNASLNIHDVSSVARFSSN